MGVYPRDTLPIAFAPPAAALVRITTFVELETRIAGLVDCGRSA
jgi:hypothetical protein